MVRSYYETQYTNSAHGTDHSKDTKDRLLTEEANYMTDDTKTRYH